MKNLYNQSDVEGIISRLEKLAPDAERKWGKMSVAQMLAHLNANMETSLGLIFPKRAFMGRILGRFIFNGYLKGKSPMKNAPTIVEYKIIDERDFEKERTKAIKLIKSFYENGPEKCSDYPHPFFGKLSPEECAFLHWMHADYHLGQFSS
ncbi:MAG: DUF1569 domain-containing protein [Cyclobacteriaceae bacterium]|nr:DUF1569 domain-containing protein [Cyclobacteriaceae bacterium]